MTKSSYARVMKKKSEKLREKAKRMMLKDYPKLMEDEEMRKKTFAAIDNANVAVDSNGEMQIIYEQNNELNNLK
jgi:signal transduction protein with GAF and PtsI domain